MPLSFTLVSTFPPSCKQAFHSGINPDMLDA
jgi:hypothetical protein